MTKAVRSENKREAKRPWEVPYPILPDTDASDLYRGDEPVQSTVEQHQVGPEPYMMRAEDFLQVDNNGVGFGT